jgi:DNA-binding Lrp family transcriptional regulator
MPKTSKDQISKDELIVLSELHRNSRRNIETIAQHSGFSKQKVSRIISRLEQNKMIWGYTAITDEERQGLQKFMLLLKQSMKIVDKETSEEISLSRLEDVYSGIGITIETSYFIHGDYDWILIFTANDLKHAKKFCSLLMAKYPGLISRYTLMQILYSPRHHYIHNPNPKKLREVL